MLVLSKLCVFTAHKGNKAFRGLACPRSHCGQSRAEVRLWGFVFLLKAAFFSCLTSAARDRLLYVPGNSADLIPPQTLQGIHTLTAFSTPFLSVLWLLSPALHPTSPLTLVSFAEPSACSPNHSSACGLFCFLPPHAHTQLPCQG